MWCDIFLIFKLRCTPRSSVHSLKIRMTSHPCNKYQQITLSYLLSVKYLFHQMVGILQRWILATRSLSEIFISKMFISQILMYQIFISKVRSLYLRYSYLGCHIWDTIDLPIKLIFQKRSDIYVNLLLKSLYCLLP